MNLIKNICIFSLMAFSSMLSAQHTVQFGVEVAEVTGTEKVYDFHIEDFINIVGWQFKMNFDGSKMSFKEIRNPILNDLSNSSFNEPLPGKLISVWLDMDLIPENFSVETVAFQLVFDIIEDEGADLCFETEQDFFEFIVDDQQGNFYLSELLISDECNQGLSIFIGSTAIKDHSIQINALSDVFLGRDGTLAFSSSEAMSLNLSLFTQDGKQITSTIKMAVIEGRQSLQFRSIPPGLYLLNVNSEKGGYQAIKLAAR